ncbi:MAG TPA: hypothetical protein VHX12_03480, partial [Acidisoma sp.]|nr:hypothetical protein [Acidisoma sp.]
LMQATYGGLGTEVSTTPYKALWSYSPDGGKTLLAFECDLSGPRGLTIVPTKTGPAAGQWTLGEEPHLAPEGGWLVRFWYGRPG